MLRRKDEINRIFRYGTVGIATNLSLYLLFLALLHLGLTPILAAGTCYCFGVALSYQLNRLWTFSSADSHRRDLPKFLLAYGIGLASNLLIITLLTNWLTPELAQLLNIGTTAIVIYSSLRVVRFGKKEDLHDH
jgi:putative flippase GtrA